jgi:hypothetical protein
MFAQSARGPKPLNRRPLAAKFMRIWPSILLIIFSRGPESRLAPPSAVSSSLKTAAESQVSTVDLGELTDFPWDSVVLLAPYTSRSDAESATGQGWPEYEKWRLHESDAFSLIVFVDEGRRTRVEKVLRCNPDFSPQLCTRAIPRSEARFKILRPRNCPTLAAAN